MSVHSFIRVVWLQLLLVNQVNIYLRRPLSQVLETNKSQYRLCFAECLSVLLPSTAYFTTTHFHLDCSLCSRLMSYSLFQAWARGGSTAEENSSMLFEFMVSKKTVQGKENHQSCPLWLYHSMGQIYHGTELLPCACVIYLHIFGTQKNTMVLPSGFLHSLKSM